MKFSKKSFNLLIKNGNLNFQIMLIELNLKAWSCSSRSLKVARVEEVWLERQGILSEMKDLKNWKLLWISGEKESLIHVKVSEHGKKFLRIEILSMSNFASLFNLILTTKLVKIQMLDHRVMLLDHKLLSQMQQILQELNTLSY